MRKRPRKNVDLDNGFGEWGGYMDAKKSKLEEQFAEDALKNPYKESNLFTGISIFVNGLTNPSAEELKRIMMSHGGVYHTYQKRSTTFVIATNLPDVKIRQITTAKIISPQWIVDCLKAKKILDYSNYLLYTNCKISQPKIAFKEKKIKICPDSIVEPSEKCLTNDEVHNEPEKLDIVLNLGILNTAIRREEQTKINMHIETDVDRNENQMQNECKKGIAKTAVDPNFISEFYNNSRLHHIATLGAQFKQHITKLRESCDGKFPALNRLKEIIQINQSSKENEADRCGRKAIMHIDMDCFFVSVGLRSRPQLKGFPVAVTHSKGNNSNNINSENGVNRKKEMELYVKRHEEKYKTDQRDDFNDRAEALIDKTSSLSEIASCSYEARKMGVKNGMFVGAALKLCPKLITIPYDFDAYKEVAYNLYDTIIQYTMNIEAVSCDEMYVDLSGVLDELDCSVDEFISHIRKEITDKTQCPCSAGIGENKLQARMATKKAKPNGQFHLKSGDVEEYFGRIPISELPGVGYSTTRKCDNLELKTCADLQRIPLMKLQQEFGKKLGEILYQNCRGIDNKPLVYDQVRKSVSAEINYGIRFTEEQEFDMFLTRLCTEVQHRLLEIPAKGKTITLKYMVRAKDAPVETAKFMGHGFCDNVSKSLTIANYTCDIMVISKTVFTIKNMLNVPCQELRGVGIQMSKLNTIQNDENKKNTLKNMFKKVEAKQKLNGCNAEFPADNFVDQSIECFDKSQCQRKPIFRKVKSFNDTPTRDKPKPNSSNRKLQKIYDELDLSVLAELPNDIQEEILKNRDPKNETNDHKPQQPTTVKKVLARKLELDFDDDIDKESIKQIYQRDPCAHISEENILNSREWRLILTTWLDCNDPVHCDVQAVLRFFLEFARAQKLCELAMFLKYLHRKIERLNCLWHQIYNDITDGVQSEMRKSFGPLVTLHVKDIDCKNCINKL